MKLRKKVSAKDRKRLKRNKNNPKYQMVTKKLKGDKLSVTGS